MSNGHRPSRYVYMVTADGAEPAPRRVPLRPFCPEHGDRPIPPRPPGAALEPELREELTELLADALLASYLREHPNGDR